MRAQTLSLRSRDFVDAAVVNGESKMHIIFRDILPNMLALTVNTVILSTMGAILTESALDFLGLGAQSQITWGTMLNFANAQGVLFNGQWWCFVFPGCAIALTVMAMIFMNNGVDAIANPRLRKIKAPKPVKTKPSVPAVGVEAGLGAAE
jgi:peptide/nickel transport system permease protein